jgi:hypothetical protein
VSSVWGGCLIGTHGNCNQRLRLEKCLHLFVTNSISLRVDHLLRLVDQLDPICIVDPHGCCFTSCEVALVDQASGARVKP